MCVWCMRAFIVRTCTVADKTTSDQSDFPWAAGCRVGRHSWRVACSRRGVACMAAARRTAILTMLLALLVLIFSALTMRAQLSSQSAVTRPSQAAASRAVERFSLLQKNRAEYGPLCHHGPQDPCFVGGRAAPEQCILDPTPPRWHVSTQEGLIQHLRLLWPERELARTMLDLGCQAGHGLYRNVSDTLLWLDAFHAPGSLVVGVDAVLDYVLDLQHRFDHVAPYSSMVGVEKRAIHAAVGTPWQCNVSTLGSGCEFNLDLDSSFTNLYCSRTDWRDHFAMIERRGVTDHSCRITRQRAGLSASTLPLPPSPYAFSTHSDGLDHGELPAGPQRYRVPSMTLDALWRRELRGRRIHLLKADVDIGYHRLGIELAPLAAQRAFAVLVMEVDAMDRPIWRTVERFGCLMTEFGCAVQPLVTNALSGTPSHRDAPRSPRGRYDVLLKVACTPTPWWSQRSRYVRLTGPNHTLIPRTWGEGKWRGMSCGPNCMV